jgi:hypothetical protein
MARGMSEADEAVQHLDGLTGTVPEEVAEPT